MEFSFELIRESGLRVPDPIGATLGIVGALILGDAAVNAHIVSPILIIVVAMTGLCSFAIPDFSFSFHLRIYRFLFIFLGYTAGFLGISLGLFVYISMLCSMKSFGVNYTAPISPGLAIGSNSYFVKPAWKLEKRATYIMPKKEQIAPKISKKWKYNKED
jgi:spore germination protein KA